MTSTSAFSQIQQGLPEGREDPPKQPSPEAYVLAAAFVLSFISGVAGGEGAFSQLATGLVVVAVIKAVWDVSLWGYRHIRSRG